MLNIPQKCKKDLWVTRTYDEISWFYLFQKCGHMFKTETMGKTETAFNTDFATLILDKLIYI